MRTVYELTENEMNELKEAIYWEEDAEEIRDAFDHPWDINNSMVYDRYNGTMFTEDDFFCNQKRKTYTVYVTEIYSHSYEIEANSRDDAFEKAQEMCNTGEIDVMNANYFITRNVEVQ